MTPSMRLRLWLRDGPTAERVVAAVAGALVVALVAWVAAPTRGRGEGRAPTAVEVAGAARPSGPPGPGSTPGPGGAPGAATGGDSGPAAEAAPPSAAADAPVAAAARPEDAAAPQAAATQDTRCDNRATDVGVGKDEVLVGVVIYTLGEANAAIGIPPAADTKKMYGAVFDHYNQRGGIQCRRLVPRFYEDFVLNAESGRAACLQMQQDKVFAVLNNLFTVGNRNCVAHAKIPNLWATSPDAVTVRELRPYVMSFQPDYDRLMRDYVLGAHAKGFFAGAAKVGLLEQTCYPDRVKAVRQHLASIGFGKDRVSGFDFGCTGSYPTPDRTTAAVLQFRREGVTHVLSADRGSPNMFATAAQEQGYRPKYAFVDDQFSSTASNANPPWASSLDGALFIEKSQDGAEYAPGATFSQATHDCAAIARAVGLPAPTDTGTLAGSLHALACIHTKLLVAAASATRPLTRAALSAALATVGEIDLSFPAGPSVFRDAANPTGSQFWRTSVYRDDCTCVKLLDATWRPEFRP